MGIFKDENGRSYGDWTHRDQRTREEANIIMFLLLFWPVGIVLCWRSSWPLAAKIVVSILLVAMVVALAMNYNATVAALG